MIAIRQFVRGSTRGALLTLWAAALLASSNARAQSSGPTVNECSSGVVDYNTGVEQTVCLYGDASGLTASAETDENGNGYNEFAEGVGVEEVLFQGGTTVWDSGDQCCNGSESVINTIVPQLNVWYTLNSYYDEDACDIYYNCTWYYGQYGLSVQVEVTPSAPPAPSGLSATAGNGQVALSWTGSSGATSYNVYEGTSPGGESSTPIATSVSGTTYTVTGLTNGTTYYFTVAAVNSYGTSGYSNEANATPQPPPPAPIELGANAQNAQVLLSWVDDSGGDTYNVYEGTSPGGEGSTPVATGLAGQSFMVTGLSNGTKYYFKVAAVNQFGVSAYSNEASATPSATSSNVYNYSVSYDAVGNVTSFTDSVIGPWTMKTSGGASGYDTLNRLIAAQPTSCPYQGLQATWSYDGFGNRTLENFSGNLTCQNAPGIPGSSTAGYNTSNEVNAANPGPAPVYDASGDILSDSQNQYAYDADGRVCAIEELMSPYKKIGYLYDAEGNRIAKGTIQLVNGQLSCDTTQNGFTLTESYILGPGNQQLTEMTWSGSTASWGHTNVWAAGQLIATYSLNGSQTVLNFHFTDWLGTRRVLTDSAGANVQSCASLPFGNGENCPPTPTEHLFTQKERDVETGNDYFGARYYSNLSGRFLTPDWSAKVAPVPYAKMDNPQSLNLYAYVGNNPLSGIDPDGHFGFDFFSGLAAAITGNEGGTNLNGTEEFAAVNLGGMAQQQNTEIAQNGGGEKLNIDKMVQYMDEHAKGVDTYGGKCAGACHKGMAAGGIGWDKNRPWQAGKNGPWLVEHGATPVGHSNTSAMPGNYAPMKGDIAVFSGGAPHNPIGHMAIYDGKHWVSDTVQSTFAPGHHYPGSVTVYRFPQQ